MENKEGVKTELTLAQKSRIERNREKALMLRQSKLVQHPCSTSKTNSIIKIQGNKYVDSGGGFLLQDDANEIPSEKAKIDVSAQTNSSNVPVGTIAIPVTYEECLDCGDSFADSFLLNTFSYNVCDKCRDPDERHSLITRTEAKAEYLLKDCDFDKREPPLKYISRKNPHNVRWGEMKLYLHLQVQKRAMEVWGTEEELMKQHEQREEQRELSKAKKYNREMKRLRMEVRSSLFTKKIKETHVHDFGPDRYNEDDDTYTHSCQSCNYTETYEKM